MQQLSLFDLPSNAKPVARPAAPPDYGVLLVERYAPHCAKFNGPRKWLYVKVAVWRGKRCIAEIPALNARVEGADMVELWRLVGDALEPLAVEHLHISPGEMHSRIHWIDAATAVKTRPLAIGKL